MSSVNDHYNLLTWLAHIKHVHDIKKVVPTLSHQKQPKDMTISTFTIAREKNPKSKLARKKSNISFYKNNLIRFHRPHGLFSKKQVEKEQQDRAGNSVECSCCAQGCCSASRLHRHSTSTLSLNEADDELDSNDDASILSNDDSTRLPPCMCTTTTSITSTTETESENSDALSSKTRTSRESSIHDLPAELDSPDVGYKKLQQGGDLVDYDDISDLIEDDYSDNYPINVQSYSRPAVHNSLIRLALNGPFQSPINTDQKKQVLHIGCGNGDWCVDIATSFPNWLVVGIDDKTGGPIQDHRKVPKNFKFIRCYYDLLRTMKDMPSDSFDLVYCRFLMFTYSTEKYNELIDESYRICKPGGFVEFYELDMRIYGNPKAGPMTHRLNSKVFRSMEQHNLNPRLARKLGDMVSNRFNLPSQKPSSNDTNKIKQYKKEHFNINYTSLPLGLWGGKLGVMFRDDMNDMFENFELNQQESCPCHVTPQLQPADSSSSCYNSEDDNGSNIPQSEEIEVMDNEIESKKSFMNLYHVYAQKNNLPHES